MAPRWQSQNPAQTSGSRAGEVRRRLRAHPARSVRPATSPEARSRAQGVEDALDRHLPRVDVEDRDPGQDAGPLLVAVAAGDTVG
jgi:hypothetical protein